MLNLSLCAPRPTGRLLLASAALALAACSQLDGGAASKPTTLSPGRIAEIVANPERSDADRINDQRRKPREMLDFIGIRPGMVALDLSAGGGYTTELVARSIGPSGKVYGQNAPRTTRTGPAQPEGAAAPRAAATAAANAASRPAPLGVAGRAQALTAGHIVPVVQPFENPVPAEVAVNGLDLVTLMFNYHDLGHMGVDRAQMNRAVFAALKPGGMYVIADHSGRPGTGISESGTLHRIEKTFLRAEVEQAGFKIIEEGHFLRNPNDPRDKNTPEPPMPKDEFVLKFIKP